MDHVWLAVACFIFIAFALEAITGFGSAVIALSLSALLVSIDIVLPVFVPLSFLLCGFMVLRHGRHIDRVLLFKVILPGMVLGTAVGYGIRPYIDDALLKQLFGLLVLWFAGRELWKLSHKPAVSVRSSWHTNLLITGAGVTHGLFASGGPLLVYALAGSSLEKSPFRSTLLSVWLVLNGFLTAAYFIDGRLVPALPKVLALLPVLVLGVWVGEYLHHRISERHFRMAIYCMLFLAGMLLLKPH